jgi:hypothetical protein
LNDGPVVAVGQGHALSQNLPVIAFSFPTQLMVLHRAGSTTTQNGLADLSTPFLSGDSTPNLQ